MLSNRVSGGNIWIDPNGSYIYECKFCRFQSGSAVSFELHILRHENEVCPKFIKSPPPYSSPSRSLSKTQSSTGSQERNFHRTNNRHHHGSYRDKPYFPHAPSNNHAPFECHACNSQFYNAHSWQLHNQHCHSLICFYCQTDQPKTFQTEQGLWNTSESNMHSFSDSNAKSVYEPSSITMNGNTMCETHTIATELLTVIIADGCSGLCLKRMNTSKTNTSID